MSNVIEWTDAQRLEWGSKELEFRKRDLQVRTPEGLKAAQDAARSRRLADGLSDAAAARLVSDATRAIRRSKP